MSASARTTGWMVTVTKVSPATSPLELVGQTICWEMLPVEGAPQGPSLALVGEPSPADQQEKARLGKP